PLNEFERVSLLYDLEQTLSLKSRSINYPAGLFYYDSRMDTMRSVYSSSMNILNKYEADSVIREFIKEAHNEDARLGFPGGAGEGYICYMRRYYDTYLGFVFDLPKYRSSIPDTQVLFLREDDTLIADAGDAIAGGREDINELTKNGEDIESLSLYYDVYRAALNDLPVSVLWIRNNETFFDTLRHPTAIGSVIVIPVILLILITYILHVFNRTLLHPVEHLVSYAKRLESGDDAVNPSQKEGQNIYEYAVLDEKLEELLHKIEDLREQNYKEAEKADWARLQYYKLQINPHFYLNCLNTVSMLIEQGNPVAAEGMIRDLSSHFRYVFQDQRQFVSLREELDEIRALCNIYSLRAGIPILLSEQVEERYLEAMIPPLTLQTFVENSIKHRDDSGRVLNITIRYEQYEDRTKIYVQDNGRGFSEDDLKEYNRPVTDYRYTSNHVGIDNFKYRMKLLYKDKARFSFYNAPEGGAVSEITILEVLDEAFDN
ncbi:MAG: histidine kinase, partial [Lachnospiraceae bacterium]|nr:histidine kinase [Lachnospiraceae bacterium]